MLVRTSSPHVRDGATSSRIMVHVLIALVPAVTASFYFFGMGAVHLFAITILSTFAFDILFQLLTQDRLEFFYASSYVTSVLLYLILPPTVPLWLPVLGVFIALGIGKYLFGRGSSIFNPALVGRAFLVVCFPVLMTTWLLPDGTTGATPLAVAKAGQPLGQDIYISQAIGSVGGCLGETSAIALLIGGLYLVMMKVIDWRIPATYIGGVGLLMLAIGKDPFFHMISGGLMLGAIYMTTDYGTTPLTLRGRLIFALGCAILTFIFRSYSSIAEGVMYSILLMNATTPLIDRWLRPRPFGRRWRR